VYSFLRLGVIAVRCKSGRIVEAIAEEFLAKYLGDRFEPLADIPGHLGIVK
jgi:hypothetical protein